MVSQPFGLAGQDFWDRTVAIYELEDHEQEMLKLVCRTLDEIAALEAVWRDSGGVMVRGSMGQMRVSPVLAELRAHRLALSKLLRDFRLGEERGPLSAAERSSAGRELALTRWHGAE